MSTDADASIESAESTDLVIRFDARLCIHSRFCVLQAPGVFLANTPGQWLFPARMNAPALAAVARNCPSGAITYTARTQPLLNEGDPPVNTLRLRQDGPYAINAPLRLHGSGQAARRRTLCRCGHSKNKPFCDGTHAAIGFEATGEPATRRHAPLEPRTGVVEILPLRDGPLEITGPLEMVSGTGRTFATTARALLCRCGGSSTKPFCDGTHAQNGFTDRADYPPPQSPPRAGGPPSLAQWAGGRDALKALTLAFYRKVPDEPLLEPLFHGMDRRHAERVADFIAEVFGGPPVYSETGGNHVGMIIKHLGRNISEAQRARWVELMIETAAEVGLPADPAFRAAFVAYLEWGSKLALINSASDVERPVGDWPMPRWGWGAARGPDGDA